MKSSAAGHCHEFILFLILAFLLASPLAKAGASVEPIGSVAGSTPSSTEDDQTATAVDGLTRIPAEGLLPEPRAVDRVIDFVSRTVETGDAGEAKSGLYPEFSNQITGSGWISAGPGYRQWWFGDRLFVDASTTISWRSYKVAQARVELTNLARSRLAVGSQVLWHDLMQVTSFGNGSDSLESMRSEYRLTSTDVVGYTTVRPVKWMALEGRIGWLGRPRISDPAGTFERGNLATREMFPGDVVFSQSQQPHYLHADASVTIDTRDFRSRPSSGGVYRTGWSTYSDRGAGAFSFGRYEAEAAQFVPLASGRMVLAMHGWLAASETADSRMIAFYMMPSLGGGNTLRSFPDYRFHDRNLLVLNVETRVALLDHVEFADFVDAGNVAPRLSELNVDKTSYGVGFRVHTRSATFTRLDVAHGREGWQLVLRTDDPSRLARLSRRTAAAPFEP